MTDPFNGTSEAIELQEDSTFRAQTPSPGFYPADLARNVVSLTNVHYHVRPLRPNDAPGLLAFPNQLMREGTFLRFYSYYPTYPRSVVDHFKHVDYFDCLALVAEVDDRIIGLARFERRTQSVDADVAFAVADDFKHQGIGSIMLDELARAARDRGITSFLFHLNPDNAVMTEFFQHSGFAVSTHAGNESESLRIQIEQSEEHQRALAAHEEMRSTRSGKSRAEVSSGKA